MPGGQVVRRLTLDEEILGPNPSQAAKKRTVPWDGSFLVCLVPVRGATGTQ